MTAPAPHTTPPQQDPAPNPSAQQAPSHSRISYNYNQVVNAQNIFMGHAQRLEFETLDLALLQDQATPLLAHELADKLRKNTLLLLGGTYEEKPDAARQIACVLARMEQTHENEDTLPGEFLLREWGQTSDFGNLLRAIRGEKVPAVLLVHNIGPQDLSHNVGRVRDEARRGGHLLLMTTERTRDSWEVALQNLEDCWEELPLEQLFDSQTLTNELTRRITNALNRLPEGVFEQELESNGDDSRLVRAWIGGVELARIASRLQTPRRIDAFVEQLCLLAREQYVTPEAIELLIQVTTSLEQQVSRWFDTRQRDEQVLAIGLNFFDGLLDDQCFSALERWVADIRAHRDPNQRTYDYVDIENLKHHFEARTDFAGTRFKALTVAHWRCLFKAAWRGHRRKILSALPVLARMAARLDDWELNGSAEQLDELRQTVSDTLAEIGTYSAPGVQRPLLHLASSRDPLVQLVAARAMAAWRGLGRGEQLFDTLERWRTDSRPRELVEALIRDRDNSEHIGAHEHLCATLALTVAVAARYDPPNELEPRLIALLKQLAYERHTFVRLRFIHTLRSVTSLHLEQCGNERLLCELLRQHPDLALFIGSSIAHAYANDRHQVMKTLDELHAESERPRADSPSRITLLCTLAFVYGAMEYDSEGPLTASLGFKRLQDMLKREHDPQVRWTVVMAVSFQAFRNFRQVAPLLQRLMAEVGTVEIDMVLGMFEEVYLAQRRQQRGGDIGMRWKDNDYTVWMESARPLTDIEEAMLAWIKDPDFPEAQQMALRACLAFANSFDMEEARFIVRQTQQREQEAKRNEVPQTARHSASAAFDAPGWYTRVFVPTLVTLFAGGQRRKEYRRIVSGLLATSLAQSFKQPASLAFVLETWKQEQDADTGTLVEQLRTAMKWHPYAGWLSAGGGAILLLGALNLLR